MERPRLRAGQAAEAEGLDPQHRDLSRPGRDPDRPAQGDLHRRRARRRSRPRIWFAKVARKDYPVGLNLTGARRRRSGPDFYENYACGSERNYTDYCNKELEKLFDAAVAGDGRRQAQEAGLGDRPEAAGGRGAARSSTTSAPGTCWQPHVKGVEHACRTASTTAGATRTCGSTSRRAAPSARAARLRGSTGSFASADARCVAGERRQAIGGRWAPI